MSSEFYGGRALFNWKPLKRPGYSLMGRDTLLARWMKWVAISRRNLVTGSEGSLWDLGILQATVTKSWALTLTATRRCLLLTMNEPAGSLGPPDAKSPVSTWTATL